MPPALPALAPDELSCIRNALDRYVADQTAQLLQGPDNPQTYAKNLHTLTTELATLERMLRHEVVRPEDRVALMLLLRHERRQLLDRGDSEGHEVVDFINRFLSRLAQIDWEAYGLPNRPYNPNEHWGSFRITEAGMNALFTTCGQVATFPNSCILLRRGMELPFTVQEGDEPSTVIIRITRIRPCGTGWNGSGPAGMMFEGEVVGEPLDPKDGSGEAFGFVFPNGKALITNNSPDSDYTDRGIRAGLAVRAVDSRA